MNQPINLEQTGATIVDVKVFPTGVTVVYQRGKQIYKVIFKVENGNLKFSKKIYNQNNPQRNNYEMQRPVPARNQSFR